MIQISNDGIISSSSYRDFEFIEQFAPYYDSSSRYLLGEFLNIEDELSFVAALNNFTSTLHQIRRQWKEEKSKIFWSAHPPLTKNVFTDLR